MGVDFAYWMIKVGLSRVSWLGRLLWCQFEGEEVIGVLICCLNYTANPQSRHHDLVHRRIRSGTLGDSTQWTEVFPTQNGLDTATLAQAPLDTQTLKLTRVELQKQ